MLQPPTCIICNKNLSFSLKWFSFNSLCGDLELYILHKTFTITKCGKPSETSDEVMHLQQKIQQIVKRKANAFTASLF